MIVVDVETTGLDPKKHSIVSIGAVDLDDSVNAFYKECRIWDGAEMTGEALKINGFSPEDVKDIRKDSLEDTIREFLEWAKGIEDRTLAGENPSFDRGFLKESAERYGIEWTLGHRTIDMHSLCYSHMLGRGITPPRKDNWSDLNADRTLDYVGLPGEPRPHNALRGAKMEAEAFSRLIYGRGLFEEFEEYGVPDYLARIA